MVEDRIFTTEPEHIKAILATQFDSFEKGPVFWDQLSALLGTRVFNSDGALLPYSPTQHILKYLLGWDAGEIWKFHRTITRPFFSKDRIGRFDLFEKHAEDALNQAKARLQEYYPVDFQRPFAFRWIGLFKKFATRETHESSWRLAEFWSDRIRKEMEVCYRFIDPILKDALEMKKMTKEGDQYTGQVCTGEKEDLEDALLGRLVKCTEGKTASALTSLIYMLSQHPDILKRLRAEVLSKVGSSRRPTYDDVREMKYMRAVINGRSHWWFGKDSHHVSMYRNSSFVSSRPFQLQDKHRSCNMARREWQSASTTEIDKLVAEIFDPDRFLDERLKYLTSNPFIFLPFNASPRIRLGQQFAYNEMTFFLVCLLQTFSSITLAKDVQTRPAECARGQNAI
ncbi:cytochrome P450 [Pisolithus marmoratus]|nr:cytochrome P450 [Pisolithus marmoratus]